MLVRRLYAWACERLYAELAWSYDWVSWWVSGGHWAQWRALAVDYVQGARLLEIGFGTGELLPKLAERTPLTVGLELSAAMHRQTRRKLVTRGLTVPLVRARAQELPFLDGAFDTIIATFPAPYILEAATLGECARVLSAPTSRAEGNFTKISAGGRLVIVGLWVALAAHGWERLLPLFYGRPSPQTLQHLSTQLIDAGFSPTIEERVVGFFRVGLVVAERIGTQSYA